MKWFYCWTKYIYIGIFIERVASPHHLSPWSSAEEDVLSRVVLLRCPRWVASYCANSSRLPVPSTRRERNNHTLDCVMLFLMRKCLEAVLFYSYPPQVSSCVLTLIVRIGGLETWVCKQTVKKPYGSRAGPSGSLNSVSGWFEAFGAIPKRTSVIFT